MIEVLLMVDGTRELASPPPQLEIVLMLPLIAAKATNWPIGKLVMNIYRKGRQETKNRK